VPFEAPFKSLPQN